MKCILISYMLQLYYNVVEQYKNKIFEYLRVYIVYIVYINEDDYLLFN